MAAGALASADGQFLAHPVAADAGQVPVQNDHVVAGQGHVVERVLPVKDHVDGHALAAQPRCHRLGEPSVILNHQHYHGLSSARLPRSARPAQRGPHRQEKKE
jgi:hypothetical protein